MIKITLNPWPYDGNPDFEIWRLNVLDAMPYEFINLNHAFLIEKHGVCDYWLTKLFDRDRTPLQSAPIICRAYSLFKQSSSFYN